MLISHKYGYVKIDIPRTGSRSYRETLLEIGAVDLFGLSEEVEKVAKKINT